MFRFKFSFTSEMMCANLSSSCHIGNVSLHIEPLLFSASFFSGYTFNHHSVHIKSFFLLILIFSTGRCERHCPPTNISAILYFGRLRTCGSIRPLSVSFYHLFFLIIFFHLAHYSRHFYERRSSTTVQLPRFPLDFHQHHLPETCFYLSCFFSCYRKETRNQTYTRETYKKHVLNGSSALNIKLNPDSLTVRWIIYCRLPFWKN